MTAELRPCPDRKRLLLASLGIALAGCSLADREARLPRSETAGGSAGSLAPPPASSPFGAAGACNVGVATAAIVIPGARPPEPLQRPASQIDPAPPPISGGTLLLLRDGVTLVASDPDRDQVFVVDPTAGVVRGTVTLEPGDEPGRLAEDAAERVHVVLRGAGAIAVIDSTAGALLRRTPVCDLPRGIAYDAASDALQVACAEGRLVTLPASGGAATRTLWLDRDLRDVVIDGDTLVVSRFRAAELLRLDRAGGLPRRIRLASATRVSRTLTRPPCGSPVYEDRVDSFSPDVAYRALAVPGGGVALLHQRAQSTPFPQSTTPVYYGEEGFCGGSIVPAVVTLDASSGARAVYPALPSTSVAVDLAIDADASRLAVAAPGNWGTDVQVLVYQLQDLRSSAIDEAELAAAAAAPPEPVESAAGTFAPPTSTPVAEGCATPIGSVHEPGQATAVTFLSAELLAVQTREPSALTLYPLAYDASSSSLLPGTPRSIALGQGTRDDSGHDLFHLRAGGGVACASCHPEAGDDGHVWLFASVGPRRTQHVRGGVLGTEPLHWGGDILDFSQLIAEIFVGRMGGFEPSLEQIEAAALWLDRQPALVMAARDVAAVTRGRALFESEETGCARCHGGAELTTNETVDVGTGLPLQVPSLRGLAFRAPYMHDGCAATLADRFGPCGGGDAHGRTSQLDSAMLADLVAYLETL